MSEAGYSGTPLAQKLGLKDGQRALFIDLPDGLAELAASRQFTELRQLTAAQVGEASPGYDFVHLFTAARSVLEALALPLMNLSPATG